MGVPTGASSDNTGEFGQHRPVRTTPGPPCNGKPALHTGNHVRKESQTSPKRPPKSALYTGNRGRNDAQTTPKRRPNDLRNRSSTPAIASATTPEPVPKRGPVHSAIVSGVSKINKNPQISFSPIVSGLKNLEQNVPKHQNSRRGMTQRGSKNGLCRQVLRPSVIGAKHWFSQARHSIGPK